MNAVSLKRILLIAIGLTIVVGWSAGAVEGPGAMLYPDVRGDLVVFTSEGDLWAASLSQGGEAYRLTRHDGMELYAKISPDGRWIAFTGQYDGNSDVYIIPKSGGEPMRLTFHPGLDEVVGWSEDGKAVIFRSQRDVPVRKWKLYTVSIEGGFPADFGLDKGTRVSFEPNGDRFAFTRMRREQRPWKRYRGGWAMDIWVGDFKTMQFKKITDFTGTDAYPMWYDGRIYFLSDRSGRFNIFSMNPDGSDVRQHTFDTTWDNRWPSGDGTTIVHQKALDIWAYDVASGKDRKLEISLPTDRFRARDRRLENPAKYIDGYSIPNTGKRLAIAARGEVFTFPVEESGYIRRLTHDPDGRERYVAFSPDGKTVAMMSDASGEDEIWLVPSDGKEDPKQLTHGNKMWRFSMIWSPDGKYLMFADKGRNLWVANAKSGKLTKVDTAPGGEINTLEWSPDSKWISWIRTDDVWDNDVWLYNLDTKKKFRFERPLTTESEVTWDPDGKYLFFVSENYYNPVLGFDNFIYDQTSKVYIVLLAEDTDNPFAPKLVEAYDEESGKDDEEKADDSEEKSEDKEEEDETITVDLDGLMSRIYPVPIDAGNYFGLAAVSGKLYFGSYINDGMMPEGESGQGFTLNAFDIEDEEVSVVTESCRGYDFSPDKKKMVVRTGGGSFVVMDAGATEIPDEDGHVSLDGWSFDLDPQVEWRQILREVWRWQRDFFYDPNMHGVDWKGVWKQYSQLLPRISTRSELNDLIMEMIGELNIGHAYVWGGDIRRAPRIGVGLLGAKLEATDSGPYMVDHVYYGDGWGDEPVSPLHSVKNGEYIVAIDGVPLEPGDNIYSFLDDKAGKEVLLSINDRPEMKGARDLLVETTGGERKLQYFDWVRNRREYVEKATGGKVGYIHLPDMMGDGLSMWGRLYYPQIDKEGLIIDVRYNGGGFVAEMILAQLQHTLWARGRGRETAIYRVPGDAFYGPIAAICNHETGSDGETFSEGFKRLFSSEEKGKLFGTRTWGGWVGIRGGRKTVDNGANTQPEFSGWGAFDGKWLIEGPGVSPDKEVVDDPAKMIEGEDPQLDAAINYVLDELKNTAKWPRPVPPPPYPKKPLKINNMKR